MLFLLLLLTPLTQSQHHDVHHHQRCEPITIPMCAGIAYNETIFPNLLGHVSQDQSGQEMSGFFPLIKIGCSKDIQLFLCALYAPVCTILDYPIPPCRALCLSAKRGCQEVLRQFDFPWPKWFECSKFPIGGKPDELCVGDSTHTKGFSDSELEHMKTSTSKPSRPTDFSQMMDFRCPVQLQMPKEYGYRLKIGRDQVVEDCGAPCYHNVTFFRKDQIQFAHDWIGAWSVVCLFSCLFTLATFLADIGRFPYPERPIIYLTLCYCAIAVIFLVGYGFQEDIACNHAVENRSLNFMTEKTIRQGVIDDWRCTLTAMCLYFFLMAGSLWWVMLTVAWFLSAGLKWGQEAIDVKSQLFHTIAWTVPAIQTIVVLVLKKVEGDILSGVCFVGLWDATSLRYYVLAPLLLYLVLGTMFLLLGVTSLVRIRTIMKHDGTKTDKLERLIMRIGMFSVLYTLPAAALVACYFYEQTYLPDWTQLWQEAVCRDKHFQSKWQTPCRFPDGEGPDVGDPEFAVFLVKYSSILVIGIISGFWVWCRKTVQTWRNLFARVMGKPLQRQEAYV